MDGSFVYMPHHVNSDTNARGPIARGPESSLTISIIQKRALLNTKCSPTIRNIQSKR